MVTQRDSIVRLVQSQGVERPFRILLRMPESSRLAIGRLLGCDLRGCELPESQAWRIINQNLRGLQARTHRLPETLSPFARNNNWWEIVTRAARSCGVRFYPGLKDEEVERLLFDHCAAEFVRRAFAEEQDPERFLVEFDPTLGRAICSLGLSRQGTHALVAALLRAATGPQGDAREGANRLTDWLRRAMPRSWTTSISTGLRMLQQRLGEVYESWLQGLLPWARGNYGKVCAALAVIYLHDVVERTLDQFELVGS
jgi:hypothetical protein